MAKSGSPMIAGGEFVWDREGCGGSRRGDGEVMFRGSELWREAVMLRRKNFGETA